MTITPSVEVTNLIDKAWPVSWVLNHDARHVVMLANRIHRELQHMDEFSLLVLEGLGLEVSAASMTQGGIVQARMPRWMIRAKQWMEDCCTRNVRISEIARDVNVHPVHMARGFRRYMGCSPGEYMRRCRLQRVQQLLQYSGQPLAEIALACGYADQGSMTRAFTRLARTSPNGYRRNYSKSTR